MSTSRLIIGAAIVGGALFVWWFTAGSHLVALVDRITTMPDSTMAPPAHFDFDEANTALAQPAAFTFSSRQRALGNDWHMAERNGRIVLEVSRRSFVLGAVTHWSVSGQQHSYTLIPEPGDSISYTRRRSRFAWPRPFVISWLGGRLPFWSRYVYDRLVWRKSNGAVLDVVWRDEQRLEPSSGWMDQYDSARPETSLRTAKR